MISIVSKNIILKNQASCRLFCTSGRNFLLKYLYVPIRSRISQIRISFEGTSLV